MAQKTDPPDEVEFGANPGERDGSDGTPADGEGSGGSTDDDLRDRISSFLMRNVPQIAIHGGSHAIQELDAETGEVRIRLGGACSGCGISPMTIQAIKTRMTEEIPEITAVHAEAGMGVEPSFAGGPDGEGYPDAPF